VRISATRAAVLIMIAMIAAAGQGMAAGVPAQSEVKALLDVPYLSQTPQLCGGAAVAMVLRYWGERDVFPQDFASLVTAGDRGIITGTLASAIRDRGWQAVIVPPADGAAHTHIQSDIDRGRPLIALIEVGPATYHYVVIVGSTDQEIVVHDPARAPFRVLSWPEFDRAWAATGRWLMLVLPPEGFHPAAARDQAAPDAAARSVQTPCDELVSAGVQTARAGDADTAGQQLTAATRLCPTDSAPWLELAGLRFSQSRWSEAQDLALTAVRLAPQDAYAWQLLATSRYLTGDVMAALDAWNHAGEPRVDTVVIHGATRTRQPVIARALALQPRQLLTPEAFGRALRQLTDLPAASTARMKYDVINGGLATVDVFIDEQAREPHGWLDVANLGARAWLQNEALVEIAGATGAGELESAFWRWSPGRPRVAFGVALPSPLWIPGIISVDASWERQSYDVTPSFSGVTPQSVGRAAITLEERRRVGVHMADWSRAWFHWQTGVALDRLRAYGPGQIGVTPRDYLAWESTIDVRPAIDHLDVTASAGWWTPAGGGAGFATGGVMASWRSTRKQTRASWSAVTGLDMASTAAPLALWPGAGTGQGRDDLLRAHPLISDDGVLTGAVFGRAVAHSTVEYTRPVGLQGAVSAAGFVDAARAWRRLDGLADSPWYVDAGIGLRLRAPDTHGTIRIDLAHGLRGGGTRLSVTFDRKWPQ
jgi:predicted double-glycine peptidase